MTPSERILYSYHNRADMVAPIEKPVVVAPAKVAPAPVPAPVVSKPIVKPTPSVRKTYSNVKKHAAPAPKPVVKPVTYVIEEITETYQPCHTAPTAVIVEKYRF